MVRFRFKLEPLLTVRRRAEQAAQRSVAELERSRRDLEDDLRRQQQMITTGKTSLAEKLVGRLDVDGLRAHAGATIEQMRQGNRILIQLAGLHKRIDAARAELIEASRQRRAVELLRDRRYAAWRQRLDRAENAAIDELAGQAAGRSPAIPKERRP